MTATNSRYRASRNPDVVPVVHYHDAHRCDVEFRGAWATVERHGQGARVVVQDAAGNPVGVWWKQTKAAAIRKGKEELLALL